uniref:Uncharacterized protein n=1 Tax=Oryza nivara TaxID=4536 RepID=A0A0E0H1X7_ORYNI
MAACFRYAPSGPAGPSLATSVYETNLDLAALSWTRTSLGLSLCAVLRLSSPAIPEETDGVRPERRSGGRRRGSGGGDRRRHEVLRGARGTSGLGRRRPRRRVTLPTVLLLCAPRRPRRRVPAHRGAPQCRQICRIQPKKLCAAGRRCLSN